MLRTPLLPATALVEWAAAPDRRRFLADLLELPEVREAVYVASPSLYDALAAWKAAPESAGGQRAEHSLVKYVARMMVRATPFGLFSGVSSAQLGRTTSLALAPRSEYRRRTRLDNDYLFVLARELIATPQARERLAYRRNTSLYRVAGRWHYAAAQLQGKDRTYRLVSLEPSDYLDATLARAAAGEKRDALAEPLVTDEITLDEARAFIDELVDSQVLVPELGVSVTGPEPIDGMIAQLGAAGLDHARDILVDVRTQIAAIDAAGLGHPPAVYERVAAALAPLPAPVDRARLFQVDMVKPTGATISTKVAAELARTIDQLARLEQPSRNSFDEFKRAFANRYEGRTMPLAEVLDEESGVGFDAARGPGSEGSPLLAGIFFPGGPGETRAQWGKVERHMLGLLSTAIRTGAAEIELTEADLVAMQDDRSTATPDALAAFARIAGTEEQLARGEPELLLEGADGPPGSKLLGRFCHASPEIEAAVRAHHAIEEAARPDAVFAEIVHLDDGRIGNVLCRPVLRGHEIVYLGVSGAPREAQIELDDLTVALEGDRIVLASRRLGREVIPRLTTAHNYSRGLGVYRFLCMLQSQNERHGGFSWGVLAASPRLPRVRIGRTIVERAQWQLAAAELAPITAAVKAARKDRAKAPDIAIAVAALRTARELPRFVTLVSGDNELPIDFDNPMLVAALADELAGETSARLSEQFPPLDRLAVHGPEGRFTDEFVMMFTRDRATEPKPMPAPSPVPTAVRDLGPGSNWLYAKIYCGEAASDRVLREAVSPVVRGAMERGELASWFFIRYHDPEPHVRVRFRGDPQTLLAKVVPALDAALAPLRADGTVYKVVVDTYVRELERYGGDRGIELVEELFWRDSEAVLAIVELLEGDEGAAARWQLAVRGSESLLVALGLDRAQRAKVWNDAREMLGREHRATTALWGQIGDRFTKERALLEHLFEPEAERDATHDLEPGFTILGERDAHVAELATELRRRDAAGELSPSLLDMAWSLVHMHANRLLHASHRAQELVIYDFLRRLHAAKAARKQ